MKKRRKTGRRFHGVFGEAWRAGRRRVRWVLAAWVVCRAGVGLAVVDPATETWPLWRNRTFIKQFLGDYGVRADVEPRVSTVERDELEKVAAMMAAPGGLKRARAYLSAKIVPADTAVMDFTLGSICFQQDQLEAARQWYQRALDKFPSFLRAHKSLGIVLVRLGDYQEAIEPLTKAIELGAKDGVTLGLLGYAFLMTGQALSAETAYRQAILLQPDVLDWKMGLARCLFTLRKYEDAAGLCEELIRRHPGQHEFWLLQANAFLGMKEPMKAVENYEYLNLVGHATPQSLKALGDIYVSEGLVDLGAESYLLALEKDPSQPAAGTLRNIDVLLSRGAYAAAARLAGRARELMGASLTPEEQKRVLKQQAKIASAGGADNADAARLLEQIVELDPLDGEALVLLGQHHAAAGDLERAAFMFERAQGMAEHEAEASLRHAQCLVRAGRYGDAVPLLKRVQELRPREDVGRYLEQVERIARVRR